MNNLADNVVNHIYDYSIGNKNFWKSKLKNVINDITYLNADDSVSEYFSNNNVRTKHLDINIINSWFSLEDDKFKQYMINIILHILIHNNHPFYNVIEYYFLG